MRSHLSTPDDMTEPQSPTSQLSPNEQLRDTGTSSTIGPAERRAEGSSSHGGNGPAWPPVLPRRRWFEHSLGIFGLVASLVGLLFIGVRTYKLAVISTENSTLEGCTGLIQVSDVSNPTGRRLTSSQAGFVTLENSTQLCKTAMKNGPLSSPYHLGKRALRSGLALASQLMERSSEQTCHFPYIRCQPQIANLPNRKLSAPAIIISTTLALGGLILIIARRNARLTDVFTSPANSDIDITRHQESGPKTVTGQGVLEKHDSGEQGLGGIHKRIRASQDQDGLMKDIAPLQSTDSSASTLVNDCSESQVSLQDHTSGEKHEGLIELQINGHTKAFFKSETGELLHLKHWKDKYKDASHSAYLKENPLSIEGEGFA